MELLSHILAAIANHPEIAENPQGLYKILISNEHGHGRFYFRCRNGAVIMLVSDVSTKPGRIVVQEVESFDEVAVAQEDPA